MIATDRPQYFEYLHGLRCSRQLCLWGTKDPTTTPESLKISRMMIPQFRDISFEGVGHWLMLSAKQEVVEKVEVWLEELGLDVKPDTKL